MLLRTALLLLAIRPAVSAEPVIFENADGTFPWRTWAADEPFTDTYLDVTAAPDAQVDVPTLSSIFAEYEPAIATPHWETVRLLGSDTMRLLTTPPVAIPDEKGVPNTFYFARPMGPGEIVDDQQPARLSVTLAVDNAYTDPDVDVDFGPGDYVGVVFDLQDGQHFGWLELGLVDAQWGVIDVRRWAYETVPFRPIGIPSCDGDANGDGAVDLADLNLVLDAFGATGVPAFTQGDMDGDNAVDLADLNLVLANWLGTCV